MHQKQLSTLREQIDYVDDAILSLLNLRAQLALQTAPLKAECCDQSFIYAPERERKILERLASQNKGLLSDKALVRIFKAIIKECRRLQKQLF